MKKNKLYFDIFLFLVLAILIYFTVFFKLGNLSIRDWDESRLACNAFEMIETGNPIVTYFDGQPDMWNTKPPVMIWLQVLSMKIFGYTEFAVRFPSAMAVIFIVILFLWFSKKFLNSIYPGYFASCILVLSPGFMRNHVARTGDYDALLAFAVFFYAMMFYAYLKTTSTKYLYLFFIAFTLALLTKGIAGLIISPVLLVFVIVEKRLITMIKSKHLYFGLFVFLIFGIGYYILREILNPGFLAAVAKNELGGRFSDTHEGHSQHALYYFELLKGWRFGHWIAYFFMALGIIIVNSFYKVLKNTRFLFYLISIIIFFLFIISLSETKLYWYDAPVYPFLAFVISIAFYELAEFIEMKHKLKFIRILFLIGFIYIAIKPFKNIYSTNDRMDKLEYQWLSYGYHFRQDYLPKQFIIAQEGYNGPLKFYMDVFNKTKGYQIETKRAYELSVNDKVLICEDVFLEQVDNHFNYNIIEEYKGGKFVEITSLK